MKKIEERIKKQFESLIKEGRKIISSAEISEKGFGGKQISVVTSWVARTGQLLENVCPKDSVYVERFRTILKDKGARFYVINSNYNKHLGVILGCLDGAYKDFKAGLLRDVKNLLTAEVFGDFLEMAEYLLNEGYKDPAAMLVGSVLEDSLRKLAINHGIEIRRENGNFKNISGLNDDLYKKKVYDKLIMKQITSWGDLRNNADHGHFDKYDAKLVKMMLLFTQKFCSDYLI